MAAQNSRSAARSSANDEHLRTQISMMSAKLYNAERPSGLSPQDAWSPAATVEARLITGGMRRCYLSLFADSSLQPCRTVVDPQYVLVHRTLLRQSRMGLQMASSFVSFT